VPTTAGDVWIKGNVGIGTTTPGAKLDVAGNQNISSSGVLTFSTSGAYNAINMNNNSIMNPNSITISDTGNGEGYMFPSGVGTSVYTTGQGGYNAFVFDTATGYPFVFNGGNVGIGTTSPGSYKLYINGSGYLNAAAWVYSSDRRLKENISYIQSGLPVIEQLKPVKFDYIKGDKKQVGFIAQEVEEVLPDIITKGEDGMLGMKTESIIPYLVKAVQEQQAEIEALKVRLDSK
jgi:hypothetical protein